MTIADCENPKIKVKLHSGEEMLGKIINREKNHVYHVVMHLMVKSAGAVLHSAYKWKNYSMRKIFGITLAVKMFT